MINPLDKLVKEFGHTDDCAFYYSGTRPGNVCSCECKDVVKAISKAYLTGLERSLELVDSKSNPGRPLDDVYDLLLNEIKNIK